MDIAFVVNPLALAGLGATLASLLRHCTDSRRLQLWFLCSAFPEADKHNIDWLLRQEGYGGRVHYLDFDARHTFGHLKSLHGDWTPYGKLLIAARVNADRVLYLDADLLVLEDVLLLEQFDLGGCAMAAVQSSSVASALDNRFLIRELNWPAERLYFNSGVMLFDLPRWRELDLDQRWQQLARAHGQRLTSHDQTLLNAIGQGKVAALPLRFNNPWYPGGEMPPIAGRSIIHFVGSPKPWDFLGNSIHRGYRAWRDLRPTSGTSSTTR